VPSVDILHERANEALIAGDIDKAIGIYNEIVAQEPTDEVALSQLMDIYLERDKFQYYLARANVNIAQGKLDHAANDVRKAINLEPTSLEAHIKLARIYKVAGKWLKAIDQFSRVIELDANEQNSYLELINLYTIEDARQSAISIALRATKQFEGDKSEGLFKDLLAKLYFDEHNFDAALDVVQNPMFEVKILLQKGDNSVAKAKLDTINPEKLDKEEKAKYYNLLAQYLYNKNELEHALEAIESYVEALGAPDAVSFQMKALVWEEKGDEFKAAYNWGLCNKVRGRVDNAIVSFSAAHHAQAHNKDVLIELVALYDKIKDKYMAAEYRQKMYELDEDEAAKNWLAEFYYEQGDLNMARKYGKQLKSKNDKPKDSDDESAETAPAEEDEGLLNKVMRWFGKG
jgi:tetratricopeptide (TPR) repeat protein